MANVSEYKHVPDANSTYFRSACHSSAADVKPVAVVQPAPTCCGSGGRSGGGGNSVEHRGMAAWTKIVIWVLLALLGVVIILMLMKKRCQPSALSSAVAARAQGDAAALELKRMLADQQKQIDAMTDDSSRLAELIQRERQMAAAAAAAAVPSPLPAPVQPPEPLPATAAIALAAWQQQQQQRQQEQQEAQQEQPRMRRKLLPAMGKGNQLLGNHAGLGGQRGLSSSGKIRPGPVAYSCTGATPMRRRGDE